MDNCLSEKTTSKDCDRHNEKVQSAYSCGGCQQTYQTISMLHEHLIDHVEGGSYHYDNNSKTAFPKYDYKCAETQTGTTHNNDSGDSNNVETQTIGSYQFKCADTQTYETCFTNEKNKSINGVDFMPYYGSHELPRNMERGDFYDQQFQSVAIKRELEDTFTNINTDGVDLHQYNADINMSINEVLTIKEEFSHEQGNGTYSADLKSETKTDPNDPNWKPTKTICKKRGRPRKDNTDSNYKPIKKQSHLLVKKMVKSSKQTSPDKKEDLNNLSNDNVDTDDYSIDEDDLIFSDYFNINKTTNNKISESHRKQLKIKKECTKCNISFSKMYLLRNHLSEVHGEQPWVCSKCGKSYSTSHHLTYHKKLEHSDAVFKCDVCGSVLSDQLSLKQHKLELHSTELKCDICDKTFSHQHNLKRHKIEQHFTEQAEYKCLECRKQFVMKCDYKHHMSIYHSERPESEAIICETCGYLAINKGAIKYHMAMKHTERVLKYSCPECPYKTHMANRLTKHMTVHTGQKDYMCYVCGKSFRNSSPLVLHMRIHSGEKPYKCKSCPKSFTTVSGYARHNQMHSENKCHTCPYCDKTFVQKTNCTAHMRQHTGDKPYICDVCGAGFTHNVSRKNHMLKVHTGV